MKKETFGKAKELMHRIKNVELEIRDLKEITNTGRVEFSVKPYGGSFVCEGKYLESILNLKIVELQKLEKQMEEL